MCGRFSNVIGVDILLDRFSVKVSSEYIKPSYNVTPMNTVSVIIFIQNTQERVFKNMQWGFIPSWSKEGNNSPRPINARSETLLETQMFTPSFKQNRCIIPLSGYYEWKKDRTDKIPYYIHFRSQEPFGLAGIYNTWTSNHDDQTDSFSILTTESNLTTKPIHNRMPVILDQDDEDTWFSINTDVTMLKKLLVPYPDDGMEAYPVSTYVNKPSNNSPKCIKPVKTNSLEDFF